MSVFKHLFISHKGGWGTKERKCSQNPGGGEFSLQISFHLLGRESPNIYAKNVG